MPRIYPLYSSSNGNSYYIGNSHYGVLIDCGVSYLKIRKALELNGLNIANVKAIFITHEHGDHIKGLATLTKHNTHIPVYATLDTIKLLCDKGVIYSKPSVIRTNDAIKVENMFISCFETSHDAISPCGYRVDFKEGKSCCVCTDLGTVTKTVLNAIKGVNAAVIEANYDVDMLRKGPYPAEIKARIRSNIGHLSNDNSGELAIELAKSGTTRFILAHISQENNTAQTALATVNTALANEGICDYIIKCASVDMEEYCCVF